MLFSFGADAVIEDEAEIGQFSQLSQLQEEEEALSLSLRFLAGANGNAASASTRVHVKHTDFGFGEVYKMTATGSGVTVGEEGGTGAGVFLEAEIDNADIIYIDSALHEFQRTAGTMVWDVEYLKVVITAIDYDHWSPPDGEPIVIEGRGKVPFAEAEFAFLTSTLGALGLINEVKQHREFFDDSGPRLTAFLQSTSGPFAAKALLLSDTDVTEPVAIVTSASEGSVFSEIEANFSSDFAMIT
ncbi:hypothetical protein [Acuticoccus kandeliae]|uniref:hypothetical protein n=1 Tax=Acuticoccus kandeliae TaxID=2073160 RepID=UPI000D3E3383|nr:hypothetical protein [Acuticoccus kandeliae]